MAQKLYLEKLGYTPVFHQGEFRWEKYYTCEEIPHFYDHDVKRDDPLLVEVVEELGDMANGDCAKLRIAEIPKGCHYRIEEYDGQESVVTRDSYDWNTA